MKNYKLIIQYEGTKYSGWQSQGNTTNTIQAKLEGVLCKMLGQPVEIHGSGRTDAGVHAKGQTANFKADTKKTKEEILEYLNTYLPQDIGVVHIEEVPLNFHSRLHAKKKTYMYRIWNSEIPNVLDRRFLYHCPQKLDIEKMKEASAYLIGQHDFKSFCANKRMKKSTDRIIYKIDILKIGDEIQFIFCGNGFLYNMIRIMVGTLVEVGEGKRKPKEMPTIMEAKNRELAAGTMPAQGLTLLNVQY
ncbi:tRNA pseudouridine(38-40) synthase TruA [Anaerosacchariphilus polymeriproducens]|uniref:tRNA pseudouridine synthase A n=1 Tax=Anaerosacchariphilus polymeriproducens TaxID=1812858 RepID=A0A371AUX2_9FIRM|nr:tRNA pseudouridine(38-40) synthase TruA [Anaerosacchariphilus polymeriproducens]RDU23332.1 tRNA pseudouridine(38-40) synthase TruA [Anaerosacchariphilus polymeriproducens]